MHLLKKSQSTNAATSDIDREHPAELSASGQPGYPNRDLMCLVFADGTTATIQTKPNNNS